MMPRDSVAGGLVPPVSPPEGLIGGGG